MLLRVRIPHQTLIAPRMRYTQYFLELQWLVSIFFFFNVYLGFKLVLSFYVVGYHIGTLSLLFYILECLHQKSWLIPLMYWWHLNHSLWCWLLLAYLEDFYKFNASSISLFACKLQIVFSSKLAHQLVHKWDAGFAIF